MRFRFLFLLSLWLGIQAQAWPDEAPEYRKYAMGPLRIAEFLGEPDGPWGAGAFTANRVHFTYKYDMLWEEDKFVARLSSLDAFSIFLPKKSWWRPTAKASLLDHEQGHFDIAESAARRLQLSVEKTLLAGKFIQGSGDTKEEAVEKFTGKLRKLMQLVNQQADQENLDYDAVTSHGMRHRSQAEHRRVQKATLDRLAKELKAVRKHKTADTSVGAVHRPQSTEPRPR